MKALLLVDLQKDFFSHGALAVENAERVLLAINKLLEDHTWDTVVASKDWHPFGHKSFAGTHGKEVGEVIDLGGLKQVLWPIHCVRGTPGSLFVSGWDSNKVDELVLKGTDVDVDSYSVFFDNGRKKETGLDQFLKDKGIDELVVAGVATDYCVKFTVLDALNLGYKVTVIPEGCKGVNLQPGDSERAFKEMKEAGAEIVAYEHFLQQKPLSNQ